MSLTVRGRVTKDSSGGITLQVSPARSFPIEPGELAKTLVPLAGVETRVTLRALIYKKPSGKRKEEQAAALKLSVLEILTRE
jgi:hypothetical protein